MPAEILNRLESLVPEIASAGNKAIGSSMKTDRHDALAAEIRAMKFIWNLPIITLEFLHDDEMICGLCDNKYDKEFRVCARGESPCCLPCGHIAGHHCLREWLSPYEGGFSKCPFCNVDFPQMFTDLAEPVLPTRVAREDDKVKRYASIDEVLERSRNQTEGPGSETAVQDFATKATQATETTQAGDAAEIQIGENEFPKNRKNGGSPIARAALKAVDLLAMRM